MSKESQKVKQLTEKLANLGPMLPGSISQQWNVCGQPGCKCKDRKHPVKHGPYYQLSFTVKGKSSSLFVKKDDVGEVRKRMRCYKQFKKLSIDLIHTHVALARKHGFGDKT